MSPLQIFGSPEVAGGGGGVAVGPEVDRTAEAGIAAAITDSNEIVPADPTKACLVTLKTSNLSGSPARCYIAAWNGNTQNTQYGVPSGQSGAVQILLQAGETYFCAIDPMTLNKLIEQTVG